MLLTKADHSSQLDFDIVLFLHVLNGNLYRFQHCEYPFDIHLRNYNLSLTFTQYDLEGFKFPSNSGLPVISLLKLETPNIYRRAQRSACLTILFQTLNAYSTRFPVGTSIRHGFCSSHFLPKRNARLDSILPNSRAAGDARPPQGQCSQGLHLELVKEHGLHLHAIQYAVVEVNCAGQWWRQRPIIRLRCALSCTPCLQHNQV
jgi:hypothetical protein